MGVAEALRVLEEELRDADKEVKFSNRPKTSFSAGNRDRATLRLNVIKKIRARIQAL